MSTLKVNTILDAAGTGVPAMGNLQQGVNVLADNSGYTVLTSDGYQDVVANLTTSSPQTITLPLASANTGRRIKLSRGAGTGTGVLTVARSGSDLINGATSYLMVDPYEHVELISTGTAWLIVSKFVNPGYSIVRDNTPAAGAGGVGSTNTFIRLYGTSVANVGGAITRGNSATLGSTYTINVAGLYSIYMCDRHDSSEWNIAISKNGGATGPGSLTAANRLGFARVNGSHSAGQTGTVSTVAYLVAGDVISTAVDGAGGATASTCEISISRVG